MAGQYETVQRGAPVGKQCAQGGGDKFVRAQHEEIPNPPARRLAQSDGVRRRGGLEADGEEDDVALLVIKRHTQRIGGRIYDAHVRAGGTFLLQARFAARHTNHVAESRDSDARPPCQRDGGIEEPRRRHANRAARPAQQLHVRRQERT